MVSLTDLPGGDLVFAPADQLAETQPGLGRVRAKTGTLAGVHGLAGTVVGADGAVMLFVALADRVAVENTLFARERLDLVAARLAACACADDA